MGSLEVNVISAKLTQAGAKLAQGMLSVEVETPSGSKRTTSVPSAQTPKWDKIVSTSVEAGETLHIRLRASDLLLSGGVVGRCQLAAKELLTLPDGAQRWVDLLYGENFVVGQLCLSFHFSSDIPSSSNSSVDSGDIAQEPTVLKQALPVTITRTPVKTIEVIAKPLAAIARAMEVTAKPVDAVPKPSDAAPKANGIASNDVKSEGGPQSRTIIRVLDGKFDDLVISGVRLQLWVKTANVVRCTSASPAGVQPVWNESLPVMAALSDVIEFSVRDADRPQVVIGRDQLAISEIVKDKDESTVEFTVKLLDASQAAVGKVNLSLIRTTTPTVSSTPRPTTPLNFSFRSPVVTPLSSRPPSEASRSPVPRMPFPQMQSSTSVAGTAEKSQFTITVVGGQGFPFGSSLFVKLRLASNVVMTSVQPHTSQPQWHETFSLTTDTSTDVMEVQVYDQGKTSKPLGRARVPMPDIWDIIRSHEDLELVIRNEGGEHVGSLFLELTTNPATSLRRTTSTTSLPASQVLSPQRHRLGLPQAISQSAASALRRMSLDTTHRARSVLQTQSSSVTRQDIIHAPTPPLYNPFRVHTPEPTAASSTSIPPIPQQRAPVEFQEIGRAVMRSTTMTTAAGGLVTRYVTESPKFRDVSPTKAHSDPPVVYTTKAVNVAGELCLIEGPHIVIFARPHAVQMYPDTPPALKSTRAPWRRVYADPNATQLAYEAKYGPAW